MGIIGYNTVGSLNDAYDHYKVGACKFTCPNESGTITDINIWLTEFVAGDDWIGGIYSDNIGVPEHVLAQTSAKEIVNNSWNFNTLSYAFSPLEVIHFAWNQNNWGRWFYDAGDTAQLHRDDRYPNLDFADPFVSDTTQDRKLSIYVNYTPAPSGPTIKKGSCVPAMMALLSKFSALKQPQEPQFQPRTFPKFTPRILV